MHDTVEITVKFFVTINIIMNTEKIVILEVLKSHEHLGNPLSYVFRTVTGISKVPALSRNWLHYLIRGYELHT